MRLIGHPDAGSSGPGIGAVDQDGNQNLAAIFREPARELRSGVDARRKAGQHLGRPVGIGDSDYAGHRRLIGLEQ